MINVKAPTGTRLELTAAEVAKVENIIRDEVHEDDLDMVVSNIGVTPGFSSIYTSNSAQHTAFVQASLKEGHRTGSFEYMNRIRKRIALELPHLTTYFQSGGLVDAVLNLGITCSDRHSDKRLEPPGVIRRGRAACLPNPVHTRGQRCLYPAGSRLSCDQAGY